MAWKSHDWRGFRRDVLAPMFFCSAVATAALFTTAFVMWNFNGPLTRGIGLASLAMVGTFLWGRYAEKMDRELTLKEKTKDRMGVD